MEFQEIIELINTVSKSNLTSLSIEEGNTKIVMEASNKGVNVISVPHQSVPQQNMQVQPMYVQNSSQMMDAVADEKVNNAEASSVSDKNIVKSPLVGTFYSAPSPDEEDFVKVGDRVKKGQVLGIVEAMKLMNEIESDFDGEIVEIMVNNSGTVEYGQPLFIIK